jgi:TMEM175 potassium channel family protein
MDHRLVNRVTAFTDGAVAIALTLLVLPLVDVAHEASETSVTTLIREHTDDALAFVLSFFVVMAFWRIHRRLISPVIRFDETLLSLNVLWLLGVVFLPVPTAVLTFEGGSQNAAAVLYMSNLLFVALMGLGLSAWIFVHPDLLDLDSPATLRRGLYRGVTVCGVMAVVTLLAVPLGTAALLLLASLPAGRIVAESIERKRRQAAPTGATSAES